MAPAAWYVRVAVNSAQNSRGFALMAALVALTLATLSYIVGQLSPLAQQLQNSQRQASALIQAQDALIGYALRYREEMENDSPTKPGRMYGYLPLPDLGSSRNNNVSSICVDTSGNALEGCDANYYTGIGYDSNGMGFTAIGRFPWRMLGTGPLKDADGECLWLIVSGGHGRIQRASPPATPPAMNPDTLGQLDVLVARDSNVLMSVLTTAHERPIAIVFSPGPTLAGQDRSRSITDRVNECGGNYNAANYLDPSISALLPGFSNYFSGSTNNASGDTSITTKSLSTSGTIQKRSDNSHLISTPCPQDVTCSTVANDRGLAISSDRIFDKLRSSSRYTNDLNALLDRIANCLRDNITAGTFPTPDTIAGYTAPADKIAGRVASGQSCYDDTKDPLGYFSNYKDLIFVAKPVTGNFTATIDGVSHTCAAVIVYANQRNNTAGAIQLRSNTTERNTLANYLEGNNLASFTSTGSAFSGAGKLASISGHQTAYQDILRCVSNTASFTPVTSAALASQGYLQLSSYTAGTLTLGAVGVRSNLSSNAPPANSLFGCAWQPEQHATGSGLRSYFRFRIIDRGDGFVFALIDGDANPHTVCGAARQHLGYSGNNTYTSAIAAPKIGLEFDNVRDNNTAAGNIGGFNPTTSNTLTNGRGDPDYTPPQNNDAHAAIVYWGGENSINTTLACGTSCTAPRFCNTSNQCVLPAEEDDNVHNLSGTGSTASRAPPKNPGTADAGPGIITLDRLGSTTASQRDFHVRLEVTRNYPSDRYNSRIVRVVASGNLDLSGLQTVDGVTLTSGDRVLVTAQTTGQQNGVYVVATGAWTRATPEDEATEMPTGSAWIVREGTTNAWTYWQLTYPSTYTLNTTPLTISKVTAPWKTVATTNNALTGLPSLNGVQLVANDWVLVTAQTTTANNGVYKAQAGAWERIPMYQGSYTVKAWILPESTTVVNQIALLKRVTQAMNTLDANFAPSLSNAPIIYDVADVASANAGNCTSGSANVCAANQWCGLDKTCYRPAFRTTRLGFTNGQGTQDQSISISDFFTTWQP